MLCAIARIEPTPGVRELIGAALVQFTLSDPDPAQRARALDAIAKSPSETQLEPLRAAVAQKKDYGAYTKAYDAALGALETRMQAMRDGLTVYHDFSDTENTS